MLQVMKIERTLSRSRRGKPLTLIFKVEIPEFEGQLNPDEFKDWMNTVERVFEYKGVSDDKQVKLVALKLCKYASIWWSTVVSKRARKEKDKIRSWSKMKEKLKTKFLPPTYKTTAPNSITLDKSLRAWRSIPVSLRDLLSFVILRRMRTKRL